MYNKYMEKISIIVPVYNVENYLEECVDSLINQTYSNIEIIEQIKTAVVEIASFLQSVLMAFIASDSTSLPSP